MDDAAARAILIVDDEPSILSSLRGLLRTEFEVHGAGSAAEAIELCRKQAFDVALCDQRMPGMTGVELMAQIREIRPDTVRILFTGHADIQSVIDAINLGQVYAYLSKPWEPERLLEILRRASARSRHLVERRQLLRDLRRSHAQHMALFEALRHGQLGNLSAPGRMEAARLAATGRALLDSLDRVLERGAGRSPD